MSSKKRRNFFADIQADGADVTETRRLIQNLMRQASGDDRKVYMMASASRGEGKSTLCALLATVAARVFQKQTLIIDADMRRPTMHLLLDLPQQPGLYELLQGHVSLDVVLRPTPLLTLKGLTSGRVTGSQADAYRDTAFADLIRRVRPSFDFIFVDAAPIVPVTEPLLMAEHVDGILVVAMAGKSGLPMLHRMSQLLTPVLPKVVGAVVNNPENYLPYYYEHRYYGYRSPDLRRGAHQAGGTSSPATGATPDTGRKERHDHDSKTIFESERTRHHRA